LTVPRIGVRWTAAVAALAMLCWSLGFLWFVQVTIRPRRRHRRMPMAWSR